MSRRWKTALVFPLLALVYGILVVTERWLEGDHVEETRK